MRHTLSLPGRCLAAILFTAIGLIASGCGDSATVNPVVELASLSVGLTNGSATLQPGFSGGTTQYRVDVTTDIPTVTVTAQAAVAGDTVTIDGQRTTSRSITLDPPGSTTVINVVVSETDTNSRTYVIRVVRAGLAGNNSLENLTVSPGTLAQDFDPNLQAYTTSVANNVGSITVTPTLSDTAATMTVNGQPALSGQAQTVTLNGGGEDTVVTIAITAPNGTLKNYQVTVSRGRSNNNNLRSLGISPGTLSPTFRAGTTGYTVNLPATLTSNVTNIRVTPTLQDGTATMTVNGQAATSGQAQTAPLPTPGSNNFVNIVVVAQDGTPKTYSVNVIRDALGGNNNLQSLAVSPTGLNPPFTASTTGYTLGVGSGVSSVTVTPRLQDTAATMTVNGQATNSGQARTIVLRDTGLSTTISIVVRAQNGSEKPYTITVDRAAPPPPSGNNNLQSLTVSPGPLSPTFNANTTAYTVDVGSGVNSVTVTPRPQDTAATLTVTSNGQVTTSGQARTITLRDAGLSTTINIVVRALNGSEKLYAIIIDRAAPPPPSGNNNLQNLTVSPGTLSPLFSTARARTDYAVNDVSSSATSITVTAAPQDSSATVEINQQAGNSRSIFLPTGPSNTEIEVRVMAPNGTAKTYFITVNQPAPAAPPAPASAPDLITEDDTCPSGIPPEECAPDFEGNPTSRSDNVTTVTRPRFTVAQPGAGETPHLYVDGTKVKDGFDQGTNTLTPPSPLSDGVHSITSTVSNGGGESGPSPALSVTIDTVALPPPPPPEP